MEGSTEHDSSGATWAVVQTGVEPSVPEDAEDGDSLVVVRIPPKSKIADSDMFAIADLLVVERRTVRIVASFIEAHDVIGRHLADVDGTRCGSVDYVVNTSDTMAAVLAAKLLRRWQRVVVHSSMSAMLRRTGTRERQQQLSQGRRTNRGDAAVDAPSTVSRTAASAATSSAVLSSSSSPSSSSFSPCSSDARVVIFSGGSALNCAVLRLRRAMPNIA